MASSRARRPATTEAAATATDRRDDDEDGDEAESGPLRRCAVTRERLPKERMIRFVVAPDRALVPDLAARLPGRGIWLSARGDVIETARIRGAFAKAARGPVAVPPDLLDVLQAALARRIGEHLGLARRAGQAVAGFAKVREWLQNGRAALIVQASDGSADERARLVGGWNGPVIAPLPAAALGGVFGREQAVHVAVAAGGLAERLRVDAERLDGLRSRDAQSPTTEVAAGFGGRRRGGQGRVQAGR
jgi:uncharacterized protein